MADPLCWQLLGTEEAYRGFLLMQSRCYLLPDGRETRWDILAGGASVAVLALTIEGSVVLAEQYRPGPGVVLAELPGGMVDPQEDPATAAGRELLEETGYQAGHVRLLGGTWLSGFSTIYRYAALATGCQLVQAPHSSEDEFVRPVTVSRAQFLAQLRAGNLTDADAGYRCADALGWLAG